MNAPRFSLIVSNMNGGADLKPAVESALAQTYASLEIILLDNGSSDGTDRYLESVAQSGKDPRVVYIKEQERVIAPANWNRVVPRARGEYVSILHADDVIHPEYVAQMVEFMQSRQLEWACCFASNIDETGKPFDSLRNTYKRVAAGLYSLGAKLTRNSSPLAAMLAFGDFIVCPTVAFRKETYLSTGGFDAQLRYAVDWEYWLRLSQKHRFGILPRALYYHRVHRQADSKQNQTNPIYIQEEYQICQTYLKGRGRLSPVRLLNWAFLSLMFFADALTFLKKRDLRGYRTFVRALPREFHYLGLYL